MFELQEIQAQIQIIDGEANVIQLTVVLSYRGKIAILLISSNGKLKHFTIIKQ